MVFNSYYINILFRIVVLSATNLGFFYFLAQSDRFFTTLLFGIFILIEIVWLFAYVNITNRNLARFLITIGEDNISMPTLKLQVEKTFRGLDHSFNRVNREISRIRLEKEYTSVLFHTVIDQLGTGILAWNEGGEIELLNRAGTELLNIPLLRRIDEIDGFDPNLKLFIINLTPEEKALHTIKYNDQKIGTILFRSTEFRLGDKIVHLVSFQNILSELEEKEMQSWEKLIRVLTHEVSNSITPIVTLGVNIRQRLKELTGSREDIISLTPKISQDILRSRG